MKYPKYRKINYLKIKDLRVIKRKLKNKIAFNEREKKIIYFIKKILQKS